MTDTKKNSEIFPEIYKQAKTLQYFDDMSRFETARPTEEADIINQEYERLKTDRHFDFQAFMEVCFEWDE